jgi:hypothetical protein
MNELYRVLANNPCDLLKSEADFPEVQGGCCWRWLRCRQVSALHTVRIPARTQIPPADATPHGYTVSLLLFIVPIIVIGW